MKMRKAVGLVVLALALGAGTASASVSEGRNCGKVSVGYQGQDLMGINNFSDTSSIGLGALNGLSVRSWVTNQVGIEGNLYVGNWKNNEGDGEETNEVSVLLGTVKGLWAPVVRENSRFYVGLEVGFGSYDQQNVSGPDEGSADNGIYIVKPLIGVEYNFAGIPELGINFEVGYLFAGVHWDEQAYELDAKSTMSGTSVGLGAHYYF